MIIYGENQKKKLSTREKSVIYYFLFENKFLLNRFIQEQIQYRKPMTVKHYGGYYSHNTLYSFPICPRCDITMEREYQRYCDRCGQCLDWSQITTATYKDLKK